MSNVILQPAPTMYLSNNIKIKNSRKKCVPGFASGFSIHHDDFPVPSFCTLIKRLCSDKLCRIEF